MTKRKPLVVVTRKLPDVVETRMMELFNTRLNASDAPMGRAELIEAVKTAEVLVPTVTDRIDKAVLLQAGDQLKLIANFGNGVDNIDHRHQHAGRADGGHCRFHHGAHHGGVPPHHRRREGDWC